jgi:hypothetical protein
MQSVVSIKQAGCYGGVFFYLLQFAIRVENCSEIVEQADASIEYKKDMFSTNAEKLGDLGIIFQQTFRD